MNNLLFFYSLHLAYLYIGTLTFNSLIKGFLKLLNKSKMGK